MGDINTLEKESQESYSVIRDKDISKVTPSLDLGTLGLNSQGDILQDSKESKERFLKWVNNPLHSEVDFRNIKASNFSLSIQKSVVEYIGYNQSFLPYVTEEIQKAVDLVLPKSKYFIPNPSATQEPSRYFIETFSHSKHVGIGRVIQVDIDEKKIFKRLGLETEKDIEEKLNLITAFHEALRTRNDIDKATDNLEKEYYDFLGRGYSELINEIAHNAYWSPMALQLLPVYNNYYNAQNPKPHYFLYPFFFQIISYFNRSEANASISAGPPIELFEKAPFKGNMFFISMIYFKYENSLFGKFKLIRNGKEY
jgi:hypothetical protein